MSSLLLKLHHSHQFCNVKISNFTKFNPKNTSFCLSIPTYKPNLALNFSVNSNCENFKWVSAAKASDWTHKEEEEEHEGGEFKVDYLAPDGEIYQKTLRLVECAMFAAVSGLAYILSNSLSVENYFGCFFALPIVFSSMRWGVSAARKTMVATFVLLFVLSGPVKAVTYLLMHGLLGFTMGSLWRLRASWVVSVFFCTIARAVGAIGYVLVSSFLIEENILSLILVNVHASVTYLFTAAGFQLIPSMNTIYGIFGSLLFLNCASFVFLLHIFYAVFFSKYGMKASLRLPRWLDSAI